MSIRSMTGYGRGEARSEGILVAADLSSVNRRQFDVQISLPKSLTALEARVMAQIHKTVHRGRVSCTLTVRSVDGGRGRALRLDSERAAAYIRKIRGAAKALGLRDDLAASLLLQLPHVVEYEDAHEDTERIWRLCSRALAAALRALGATRKKEGQALQTDIAQRMALLGRILGTIRRRAPRVVQNHRQALRARLKEMRVAVDINDERLVRELAFFAERSDITEEITRLGSHLAQAAKLLDARKSIGRELEFLGQEMLREINTIGAKSNDVLLQKDVIQFKSELERIREQAQNVE
ncbi:MAG: YicC family protein [Kiritimatiellae bacterium]|nr:YicC family protein [Kiritimatiellia bacterium]